MKKILDTKEILEQQRVGLRSSRVGVFVPRLDTHCGKPNTLEWCSSNILVKRLIGSSLRTRRCA